MEKIIDVFGYSAEFDDVYRTDDSWFGRVLVGEDNQFEGVVEDFYQTDYYFVFGEMKDKSIRLIKLSRNDRDVPYLFEATKENRKFYGDYSAKNLYVEIPLGECQVSLLPADATREESDYEKDGIRLKMEDLKQQLGEIGQSIYQDFSNSKGKAKEIIKK